MRCTHPVAGPLCLGLASVALCRAAFAQQPVGTVIAVNDTSAAIADKPAVGVDAEGNFVVLWQAASDGSGTGISGRRYDAAGLPLGAVFPVNAATVGAQAKPDVAMMPTGEFVAVWQGPGPSSATGIFGRRYDAAGVADGAEFQVNTATTTAAQAPAVAADPRGGFVVAWLAPGGPAQGSDLFARRFDQAGAPVGSEFRVNEITTGEQLWPSIGVDRTGSFVAAWINAIPGSVPQLPLTRAAFRRFDASDAPQGADVPVGAVPTFLGPYLTAVAVVPDGSFLVAWDEISQEIRLRGRSFDALGAPLGPERTITPGPVIRPAAVVATPARGGEFVVAWQAETYSEPAEDYIDRRIEVQALDPQANPASARFVASAIVQSYFTGPDIAGNTAGQFVVAWAHDLATPAVEARRLLRDYIFGDGFDSGALDAWTSASVSNGDLRASVEAALAGTAQGLEVIVNDTQAVFVRDATPVNELRYRARFHLDPNGFDPGEAMGKHRTIVFIALEESPVRRLAQVTLRRLGGAYAIRARVSRDDGTRAETPFVPITDAPHAIEIDWVKAAAPGAADGSFQLWVDGVPSALSGLDNDEHSVDFVRLGAMAVKPGAGGVLYFDRFESRRVSFMGP